MRVWNYSPLSGTFAPRKFLQIFMMKITYHCKWPFFLINRNSVYIYIYKLIDILFFVSCVSTESITCIKTQQWPGKITDIFCSKARNRIPWINIKSLKHGFCSSFFGYLHVSFSALPHANPANSASLNRWLLMAITTMRGSERLCQKFLSRYHLSLW